MKKIIALCSLCSLLLITGCASVTPAARAARIQVLCTVAADTGAHAALIKNPEYRVPLELASAELHQLVVEKKITGAVLHDFFTRLPVKELNDPNVTIYIDAALTLYDATIGEKIDLEDAPYVLAAATGLDKGLLNALARAPAKSAAPSVP